MKYLFKNIRLCTEKEISIRDILVDNEIIGAVGREIICDDALILPYEGHSVFPGFTDVHVHLREPGFSYKETIAKGTMAAAAGGFVNVCAMPNLKPCPDCLEALEEELTLIRRDARIRVVPYGCITRGQRGDSLVDYKSMSDAVAGFSDDGRGVQNRKTMLGAMRGIAESGSILAAHCEDESLVKGGYIHDGNYAWENGHRGICSESEWGQIKRDIELLRESVCKYHVCHVSTKEGVELVRKAKAEGLNISCETAPHYLSKNDSMLKDEGRFKMNPPIRGEEDRLALIEGIRDGTIDLIATDHAPHSAKEKSMGLKGSSMGVVGLETSFPVCYTELVRTGIISLQRLIELMHGGAKERFGIGTELTAGQPADLTVFDLNREFTVNPEDFYSMGRASPFQGERLYGLCKMTMLNGDTVFESGRD